MNWYALQVRSCCEPRVEEMLTQAHIEGFFPHEEVKRTRGEIYRKPFFPGYVFTYLDLDCQRHPVIQIPQVVRFVSSGLDPLPIPESQIESVKRVAEFAEQLKVIPVAPSEKFTDGQRVLVKSGPLRGITGYVAYHKSGTRLVVAVQMLNQAVSAEVDATWLEPIQ